MNRTELKRKAQYEILQMAMQSGLATAESNTDNLNDEDMATLTSEMSKQLERIEKLFGYEPGSWMRG